MAPGTVTKAISSARARGIVEIRRVISGRGNQRAFPEHPTWWTPAREALCKTLWEANEMTNVQIAERLRTNYVAVGVKAAEMGKAGLWSQVVMVPAKKGVKGTGQTVGERVVAAALVPKKTILSDALPGSEPKPFYKLALKGECTWILDDRPGAMDECMACAMPSGDNNYCPEHSKRGVSVPAAGRPASASALARSLRRYA